MISSTAATLKSLLPLLVSPSVFEHRFVYVSRFRVQQESNSLASARCSGVRRGYRRQKCDRWRWSLNSSLKSSAGRLPRGEKEPARTQLVSPFESVRSPHEANRAILGDSCLSNIWTHDYGIWTGSWERENRVIRAGGATAASEILHSCWYWFSGLV